MVSYRYLLLLGVWKDAPTCVYHVVFDWKMVLVSMGGVPMSSDVSKCVNFCVFLDIAEVSSVAPTQKTIFVFIMLCLIGKWYWCQWVESQCPAMCQNVSIFVYFWTSLGFQVLHQLKKPYLCLSCCV